MKPFFREGLFPISLFPRILYTHSSNVHSLLIIYVQNRGVDKRGAGDRAPRNLADHLTLSKPGGQIMPLTLLPAPWIQKAIYTSAKVFSRHPVYFTYYDVDSKCMMQSITLVMGVESLTFCYLSFKKSFKIA